MTPPFEQPLQTVLMRWKDTSAVLWADLECGHQTPCTARPVADAIRCPDCPPVRKGAPARVRSAISVSCEKGRHRRSCSGTAWDYDLGEAGPCTCTCHPKVKKP